MGGLGNPVHSFLSFVSERGRDKRKEAGAKEVTADISSSRYWTKQQKWMPSSGCPVISGFSYLCGRSPGMGGVPRCLCWAWVLILWKEDNIHSLLFNTIECLRHNIIPLIPFAEVAVSTTSWTSHLFLNIESKINVICVYGFFFIFFFFFLTRFSDFSHNLHVLIECHAGPCVFWVSVLLINYIPNRIIGFYMCGIMWKSINYLVGTIFIFKKNLAKQKTLGQCVG